MEWEYYNTNAEHFLKKLDGLKNTSIRKYAFNYSRNPNNEIDDSSPQFILLNGDVPMLEVDFRSYEKIFNSSDELLISKNIKYNWVDYYCNGFCNGMKEVEKALRLETPLTINSFFGNVFYDLTENYWQNGALGFGWQKVNKANMKTITKTSIENSGKWAGIYFKKWCIVLDNLDTFSSLFEKPKPELNKALILFNSPETIENLKKELKGYFQGKEAELEKALQGEQLQEPLLFPHNQNKFVEVFKRLKYNGFLLSKPKEINNWICSNFTYTRTQGDKKQVQPFNKSTIKTLLTNSVKERQAEPTPKERICTPDWLPHYWSNELKNKQN